MSEPPPQKPKTTRRDALRISFLGLVTVLVFYLILRNVPFRSVAHLLASARPVPLIVGMLITVSFPLLSGFRWRAMMAALGRRLTFGEACRLIMACWSLATFTPSKGSDLAKAYFLRGRMPVSTVLGSVLAERLLDVLVLLGFCFAGSLIHGWWTLMILSGAILAAGVLGTAAILTIRLPVPVRLRPKVERLLEALRVLLRRPGLFALVLVLTCANWLASIIQTWLFYRALGTAVPLGSVVTALPAAIFVGLLPLTVAGMGTRDAALIRLLAQHAAAPVSLGVGLLYSLCGYWLPGLVGLPFLRWAMRR